MVNTTLAVQEDCEEVLQIDAALPFWRSEATLCVHVIITEEGVDTSTHERVGLHVITNDIASITLVSKVVLCHVVRQLTLVEKGLAILTVPDCQIMQGMLRKQSNMMTLSPFTSSALKTLFLESLTP